MEIEGLIETSRKPETGAYRIQSTPLLLPLPNLIQVNITALSVHTARNLTALSGFSKKNVYAALVSPMHATFSPISSLLR
jgi:hypothetical protein